VLLPGQGDLKTLDLRRDAAQRMQDLLEERERS
jgi:hypothetical protein